MRGIGALRPLVVVAAGIGLVWGAGQVDGGVDLARADDSATSREAVPAVSHRELVCPGADRPGVPGVADQSQQSTIITASAPASLLPKKPASGGSFTAATLPGDQKVPGNLLQRGSTRPIRIDGPAGADLTAKGGKAPGLSALQVGLEQVKSVKGLSMLPCSTPAPTSYLIAGGAQAGQDERLVLSNPGPNPVPVTVSVLGTKGRQSVVVPSRSRKVVVLGSVDDTSKAPVVKVAAGRGTVGAALVEATFAGAVARGTEVVGPTQAPGRTQIVPALVSSKGGDTAVRVGVPGADDAIVRLSLIGPAGQEIPDDIVRTVKGHSTTGVSFSDLPPGNYAVRITSDEPVVAAGRSRTSSDDTKTGDLLWAPSTAPLSGLGGVAIPKVPGGKPSLVLAAPGEAGREVTVSRVDGEGKVSPTTVTIPGGETHTVDLGDAASVWVEPASGSVSATLVVTGKDGKQPLLSGAPLPAAAVTAPRSTSAVRPAD